MRFGDFDVHLVTDGQLRLDGGSMFSVVPKVLWERDHPADEKNRIEIALNCLLVRGHDRVVLVDTGMGHDWSEVEIDRYALTRSDDGVVDALQRQGVSPADVTDVVLTHLHFDHAGGVVDPRPTPRLTFPRARHWVQRRQLEWAQAPTERDRRSFRVRQWSPLLDRPDLLQVLDGPHTLVEGLRVEPVHGHCPGQQIVWIDDAQIPGGLVFCGDLVPLASHLRLPYTMSFDLDPVTTLKEKKDVLQRAADEGRTLVFEHDVRVPAATVAQEDGEFVLKEPVSL